MVDLGEFDARRSVRLSAEEDEAVFARHSARMQAVDWTIHNPRLLMQDTDRRLFAWFLNRLDARWTLRQVLSRSL